MRPSIVLPSAACAVALTAAGLIWATSGTTTSGRPAGFGAVAAADAGSTSASPTPTLGTSSATSSPTASKATTPAHSSAKRPVNTADASAAPHAAGTIHRAAPRPAAHGSCGGSGPTPGASSLEASIFAMLNRERAANGLCPMIWSPILQKSAHGHSVLMDQKSSAADCSDGNYSHVYPGEPDIESRIVAAGYAPGPVAEAIGCSPDPTLRGAESLQTLMYNEKPPANQHREMILSRVANHVGISIVVDPNDNTLWLTEDYAV